MNKTNNIFLLLIIPFFTFSQYNIDVTTLEAHLEEQQNINIFTTDSDVVISGDFLCKFNNYSITIKSDHIEYSIRVTPSLLEGNSKISVQDDDEDIILKSAIINIHPNPTKNKITINSKQKIKKIEVYNSYGIKQTINQKTGLKNDTILNIENYKTGLYILKIYLNNNTVINKTIIKQ